MVKVAIAGIDGNMGGLVAKNVLQDPNLEIVAGFTISQSPNVGKDIGTFHGGDAIKVPISSEEKINAILESTNPEVYVDFTIADAAEKNCPIVAEHKIKSVIGTTALSTNFLQSFENLLKKRIGRF